MARVINKLPPSMSGRIKKYPYEEWLDGRAWVILSGEDYRCDHLGMRSTLYQAAKRRGGVLETRKLIEGHQQIGWAFQFHKLL